MLTCWCGSDALDAFAEHYLKCAECGTLVSTLQPADRVVRVHDDQTDFYGREYWFSHQETDLNTANLELRARQDLTDRCLHWLRTMLRYLSPPAEVLELGAGHGGFVALLRWLDFDARGLELSPWVVGYARATFGVPMLLGPIEDQSIPPNSLDALVLMDVLEHLPDPKGTMNAAMKLLKPQGFVLVQTPRTPAGASFADLEAKGDRFLEMLVADEHLYLFTEDSVKRFFRELGADHVQFEPAIFAWYDMFAIVSSQPLAPRRWPEVEGDLQRSPQGRLMLALLDAGTRALEMEQRLAVAEADRAARLHAVEALQSELQKSEADRAARLQSIETLQSQLQESESDRAARLQSIEMLQSQLQESESDRTIRMQTMETLQAQLEESESDRAARLTAIEKLQAELTASEQDRAARLTVIEDLQRRLAATNEALNMARQELTQANGHASQVGG